MRILIVSDAWAPQVNGVVTSLQALVSELRAMGHLVKLLSPQDFRCLPCPSYAEIPLAWDLWRVGPAIRDFRPDCVHLATEGPLGWAARRWLKRRGLAFSSAIHTRFPEYVHTRWPRIPLRWGYAYLRRFHRPSQAVLVSTERLREEFAGHGLRHLRLWHKGVDTALFRARPRETGEPVFLYVGRLAAEKNLRAFLELELPGRKCLVGDGPQRDELQRDYPQAQFLGYLSGEALACGTPVAAFPVAGPLDVLQAGVTGMMDEDLAQACRAALQLDRAICAEQAARQSWRASALEFLASQALLDGEPLAQEDWLPAQA